MEISFGRCHGIYRASCGCMESHRRRAAASLMKLLMGFIISFWMVLLSLVKAEEKLPCNMREMELHKVVASIALCVGDRTPRRDATTGFSWPWRYSESLRPTAIAKRTKCQLARAPSKPQCSRIPLKIGTASTGHMDCK